MSINNATSQEVKNSIELLIYSIAVKNRNTELINEIKEKIRTDLDISAKYLTYLLENRRKISKAELQTITSILQKYDSKIKIKHLIDF